MLHGRLRHGWLRAALAGVVLATAPLGAELDSSDLALTRTVTEKDWLELELEVLGLRLSFPAYRVELKLDSHQRIDFAFLASSGLARQLTEDTEQAQAKAILEYHANGIREQVEDLLKTEFPLLWERYDPRADFHGEFLRPGAKWDDPPETFCQWREGVLHWHQ